MGLFSIFKKNSSTPDSPLEAARDKRRAAVTRPVENNPATRLDAQNRQRELARATTMKIDAIEAAMAADIFNAKHTARAPTPAAAAAPVPAEVPVPQLPASALEAKAAVTEAVPSYAPIPTLEPVALEDEALLADDDGPSTEMLSSDELPEVAVAAQSAPIVEEIAMLYANNQWEPAEQVLVQSLVSAGADDRTVWWMLFDLLQVTDQQEKFDNLSIDYASKFETSPPAWTSLALPVETGKAFAGVTPTMAFTGVLDDDVGPQLGRMLQLAGSNPVLRLELGRISKVEPGGCALLLPALKNVQGLECELIVSGAAELAQKIRALVQIGVRDDTESAWLLLLELLQLLNREKEFEETSMDYCITFEVSPPPFVPPTQVVSANVTRQLSVPGTDRFMLPAVIEGDSAELLEAIDAYAEQSDSIVFDCSRLARLDFGTASKWRLRLQALTDAGKRAEFRDVNHLVAALLRLLGFADIAKIFPNNY